MYLLLKFARAYPKLTILLVLYLVSTAYFLSKKGLIDDQNQQSHGRARSLFNKLHVEIPLLYKGRSSDTQALPLYEPPSRTFQVPPFNVPYVLTHVWIPRELKLIVFVQGIEIKRSITHCVVGNQPLRRVLQQNYVYECLFQSDEEAQSLDGQFVTLETRHRGLLPTKTKFRYRPNTSQPLEKKYYLCAATQILNQSLYLEDWLVYHKKLGIEYFFLYDNDSKDNTTSIAQSPTVNTYVQMLYWPWIDSQPQAFVHAKVLADTQCDWTLFFDVDEYVFVKKCLALNCLSKLLRRYYDKKLAQICFKRKIFGSSGHIRRPTNGTVADNYIHRSDTQHIFEGRGKCAVKTSNAKLHTTIYEFLIQREYYSMTLQPSVALINHYKLKSWEDFMEKYSNRKNTSDWVIPANFSVDNPPLGWEFGHTKAYRFNLTTNDTAFKAFRLRFDKNI
ncbi:unnamed protein product [Didymodactylos carnosus]|uniref:Glycosyltransferase family 92 protein n=1 Tax=Didymodactylos carnosus TaxID=1234261 RepID=A0A814LKA6_9BILA|nr:unnamed protein product [Didymodactylos carnosus]CAF1066514.1 unnamed protein product [Didymodactylos carnosus]CAF3706771.1 unnamed protein product [Didymodactylos carnosus]CAF3834064.1 unnamed protein product [Didymodactylos carnosus]